MVALSLWPEAVWHRTAWRPMASPPVTSGVYEVKWQRRPVVNLSWNGRLWLTSFGAVWAHGAREYTRWRGLLRASYEEACIHVGVVALSDQTSDRRVRADRRGLGETNEPGNASGSRARGGRDRRTDDMGLFGGPYLISPFCKSNPAGSDAADRANQL